MASIVAVVHPGVDEPHQQPFSHHPQGRVAGVDEGRRGVEDVAEHLIDIHRAGDLQVGSQQPPQPALGGLNVTGPVDELLQQLVELQPRDLREAVPGQQDRRVPAAPVS